MSPCYLVYLPAHSWLHITAPFNNKAQPTNSFLATVNQMFAGSSQLSTAAERVAWVSGFSFSRGMRRKHSGYRARGNQIIVQSSDNKQSSAVVVSWGVPPNTWLTVAKNVFVSWAFNFRVRMLLKGAVNNIVFDLLLLMSCGVGL